MGTINIRPINLDDNEQLANIIRTVLIEMGVPKVGTAYEDVALDMMYETYDKVGSAYYVVEQEGEVIGGAGVGPLENGDAGICELQKMYFLPIVRGKGVGSRMMKVCLDFAKEYGYAKCYLETMPYMVAARKLYRKTGFTALKASLGDTGHYSCQEWMIKEL